MSKRLESYLSDVESYLSALPSAVREGELREISGHLQQLSADLRAAGQDEEMALTLAIKRFGSARSVGLRLRDVWEGNRSLLVVAFAVLASNWCLQIACGFAIVRFLLLPMLGNSILTVALGPLMATATYAWLFALPLGWNFILGQWGGRRVALIAPLTYAPLLLASLTPITLTAGSVEVHSPHLGLITMTLALIGAWRGSERMRRRRMALVSGTSLEEAAKLLAKPRGLRKRAVTIAYWVLGLSLLSVGTGTWAKLRLDAMLHPSTPETAMRVLLAAPSDDYSEMQSSTEVTVRVLPPVTPAERAGRECRVAYTATMHATPAYRERRVAWMKRELQAEREGRWHPWPAAMAQAALKRLNPAGYRMSGVLPVVKTLQGWQVKTNGDVKNNPTAWLYMIDYEDQPGIQP